MADTDVAMQNQMPASLNLLLRDVATAVARMPQDTRGAMPALRGRINSCLAVQAVQVNLESDLRYTRKQGAFGWIHRSNPTLRPAAHVRAQVSLSPKMQDASIAPGPMRTRSWLVPPGYLLRDPHAPDTLGFQLPDGLRLVADRKHLDSCDAWRLQQGDRPLLDRNDRYLLGPLLGLLQALARDDDGESVPLADGTDGSEGVRLMRLLCNGFVNAYADVARYLRAPDFNLGSRLGGVALGSLNVAIDFVLDKNGVPIARGDQHTPITFGMRLRLEQSGTDLNARFAPGARDILARGQLFDAMATALGHAAANLAPRLGWPGISVQDVIGCLRDPATLRLMARFRHGAHNDDYLVGLHGRRWSVGWLVFTVPMSVDTINDTPQPHIDAAGAELWFAGNIDDDTTAVMPHGLFRTLSRLAAVLAAWREEAAP